MDFAVRTKGLTAALCMSLLTGTVQAATEWQVSLWGERRAINSGSIEGASFAPHAHMSFGTVEEATWWTTNLNPGTVN